jgi:uncharacterized protein (TIGR02145 family)
VIDFYLTSVLYFHNFVIAKSELNRAEMKKKSNIWVWLSIVIVILSSCKKDDINPTVTDIDGNVYHTVTIGTQVWMKENLKVTNYNDGTPIPLVTDNTSWGALTSDGYCWYQNDEGTYKDTYGALYNAYAVSKRNLCPTGWHVPTEGQWLTLRDYLGGRAVAGGKLKSSTGWSAPNSGADNSSGFTGLPGGTRPLDGNFISLDRQGFWYSYGGYSIFALHSSSTLFDRFLIDLVVDFNGFYRGGASVRCIKD